MSAPGSTRFASAATAWASGPITTAVAVLPAARTASRTCARSERPPTSCSTFARAERMRVPSPAARTIARQERSPITFFLGGKRTYGTASVFPKEKTRLGDETTQQYGSNDERILLAFSMGIRFEATMADQIRILDRFIQTKPCTCPRGLW